MKKPAMLIIILAFFLFSCDNPTSGGSTLQENKSINPFIGTWEAEVSDPNNYYQTHAISTLIFTETEFKHIYQWLEGEKKKEEFTATYTYTDDMITFKIINDDPLNVSTTQPYKIVDDNKLYFEIYLVGRREPRIKK